MCNYCEEEQSILEKQTIDECIWGWGYDPKVTATYQQAKELEYTETLFIDRSYLRFVDLEDSQCLDHGAKIKINFCPFCGEKL